MTSTPSAGVVSMRRGGMLSRGSGSEARMATGSIAISSAVSCLPVRDGERARLRRRALARWWTRRTRGAGPLVGWQHGRHLRERPRILTLRSRRLRVRSGNRRRCQVPRARRDHPRQRRRQELVPVHAAEQATFGLRWLGRDHSEPGKLRLEVGDAGSRRDRLLRRRRHRVEQAQELLAIHRGSDLELRAVHRHATNAARMPRLRADSTTQPCEVNRVGACRTGDSTCPIDTARSTAWL
jgi:hypothetical protein